MLRSVSSAARPTPAYDRLTAAISEIISETLGIDSSNIYIKYEEAEHWGWNGSNF